MPPPPLIYRQSACNSALDNHGTKRPSSTSTVALEEGLADVDVDLGQEALSYDGQPMLGTDELKRIQQDILETIRPTWQTSPPKNFGSPAHGKLKADQWRTCIEFDLPVSLVRMWEDTKDEDASDALQIRRKKIVESTMLLSIAIRWAVSHRTSEFHANQYRRHMMAYLKTLRELCPTMDLHPVHHNALHIPEFLLRFGPMHGWWMFPFERLIGILQKIKINFKIGKGHISSSRRA